MRSLFLFDIHLIFNLTDCRVSNNILMRTVFHRCGTAADFVGLTLSSRGRCVIKNNNQGRFKVFFTATDQRFLIGLFFLCVCVCVW